MAASQYGTAHIFGVGANVSSATIISVNGSEGFELNETTEDEKGVTVETRRDNRMKELNLTLRGQTNYSLPSLGSAIAISGLDGAFNDTYEITAREAGYQNDQFAEFTVTCQKYEDVSVS